MPSYDGAPSLRLTTTGFTVGADHDLLERADLFGLATAADTSRGHFPDRPFGFLAVHRASGLVLVAGWVATP
ncbi:hypothetical protein Srufu_010780 [Streptomyces libani subsp. rufus]|nr:hypothetical protein Srufu_010780 [Streptomyces libani subsp. rufus]